MGEVVFADDEMRQIVYEKSKNDSDWDASYYGADRMYHAE